MWVCLYVRGYTCTLELNIETLNHPSLSLMSHLTTSAHRCMIIVITQFLGSVKLRLEYNNRSVPCALNCFTLSSPLLPWTTTSLKLPSRGRRSVWGSWWGVTNWGCASLPRGTEGLDTWVHYVSTHTSCAFKEIEYALWYHNLHIGVVNCQC